MFTQSKAEKIAKMPFRAKQPRSTNEGNGMSQNLRAIKIQQTSEEECLRIIKLLDGKGNIETSEEEIEEIVIDDSNSPVRPVVEAVAPKRQNFTKAKSLMEPIKTKNTKELQKPKESITGSATTKLISSYFPKIEPEEKKRFEPNIAKPVGSISPPKRQSVSTLIFQVLYGQYKPYKKHKVWSNDGFLTVRDQMAVLYSQSGRIIGRSSPYQSEGFPTVFREGTRIICGNYEVEVSTEMMIDLQDFENGAFFVSEE